jgi:hypothetical protein
VGVPLGGGGSSVESVSPGCPGRWSVSQKVRGAWVYGTFVLSILLSWRSGGGVCSKVMVVFGLISSGPSMVLATPPLILEGDHLACAGPLRGGPTFLFWGVIGRGTGFPSGCPGLSGMVFRPRFGMIIGAPQSFLGIDFVACFSSLFRLTG